MLFYHNHHDDSVNNLILQLTLDVFVFYTITRARHHILIASIKLFSNNSLKRNLKAASIVYNLAQICCYIVPRFLWLFILRYASVFLVPKSRQDPYPGIVISIHDNVVYMNTHQFIICIGN